MVYRVARTADGQVFVENTNANFVASRIDNKWYFTNLFSLDVRKELIDVDDPAESEKLYNEAIEAKRLDKTLSAKAFYRAMYAGTEPDPEDFGMGRSDKDPPDEPDMPPDKPDVPPDPSGVPSRPYPSTGGSTTTAQASKDNGVDESD